MKQYLKHNRILLFVTCIFCIISALGSSVVPIFLQQIMDAALNAQDSFSQNIVHSIIFFSIIAIIVFLYSLFSKRLICRIISNIRSKMFTGFINDTLEHFQANRSTDYISYFVNDIKIIEDNYFNSFINIAENSILFISSLGIMIFYSPTIALFTCVAILLMLILPNLLGFSLQKKQDAYSLQLGNLTSVLKEIFSGHEVVKTYNIETPVTNKFEKTNSALTKSRNHVDTLFSITETFSLFLALLMQLGVIGLSAFFVMQGRITPGVLLALTQISGSLANPLITIIDNLTKVTSTKEILKKINSTTNSSNSNYNIETDISFNEGITLENVGFSYDNQTPVLTNINLKISKGKKYAIIGKNGCGKSTLIKLIAGYYTTYTGSITIDNIPLSMISSNNIYSIVSIIHQNIFLFNESIKDNICLYKEYSSAEFESAVSKSMVNEMFQNGIYTSDYMIEDNGKNLSGGQKQRIALARALIQNKPLIIMDEGTSAIEQKASFEIETSLLEDPSLTLVTITHNLDKQHLQRYDSIIVIDSGKIAEIGNYDELMGQKGYLHKMIS